MHYKQQELESITKRRNKRNKIEIFMFGFLNLFKQAASLNLPNL